jgi:hypothetical protein
MGSRLARAAMVLGLIVLSGACVTSQEWSEWSQNKAHFASGDHGFFSLRNRGGAPARVTRADVTAARDQGWWGTPVTVSADQIQQN